MWLTALWREKKQRKRSFHLMLLLLLLLLQLLKMRDSSSESSGFETPPETVSTDNRNDETGFIVSDVTTLLKTLDTEGVLDKKIGIIESDEEGGGEVTFEDVEFDDLPNLSQLQSQDTTGDSNKLLNKIEHFLDEEVDHIQSHPQIDQQQFDIRYRKDDESHPQDENNETHPLSSSCG